MANEFKIKNGAIVSGSITGITEPSSENSAKMASTSWVRTYVTANSGAAVRTVQSFTATAGQTTFTISGGYTVGLLDVYLNGYYLNTASYTASNGTTVVLTDAASVDDILDIIIYKSFAGFVTSSDQISEGSTNLYYTNTRVASYLTANNYATQSYVSTQLAALVASAPATLDTLNELAAALGSDPNFATTVTNSIATRLPLSGGTLTGALSGTSATFSGNLGIGTSSPARGLSLFNNTIGLYSSATGQGGTDGYTMELSGTTAYLWNYENDALILGTNNTERIRITPAGLLQYKHITDYGLVGSDAAGFLSRVNPTYTEIPTGTISYSATSGFGWGINNSFPANIRNYTNDLIAGTGSAEFNSNYGRGVTFDLGSAKSVRRIVEIGYTTKNLDTITVQYSTDNSNWTTILTYPYVFGTAQKVMEFNHTGALAARYWRWYISGWVQREETNYYTYESIIYT